MTLFSPRSNCLFRLLVGILLCIASHLLYAQDEELIEWTRAATRGDFERNSVGVRLNDTGARSIGLNEALALAVQDQLPSHNFPAVITTLAASLDTTQQAQSVNFLARFLSVKKKEAQQNIGSAFASYFDSFGSEVGLHVDPRFHELVRLWRRHSTADVAMAKICAGTMCAPGAPKEHAGAVRETFRIMSPVILSGRVFISNLDAWDRMLSTPQRKSGLIALAKRVALRVESTMQGLGTQGDIYADAVSVMASQGMDPEEAHKAAMDVLGAYATRGAGATHLYYAAWPTSRVVNQLEVLNSRSATIAAVATMIGTAAFATVNHLSYAASSPPSEVMAASAVPMAAGFDVLSFGGFAGEASGRDVFISAKYRPFFDALTFLGVAMPYLDGIAHRRGESYSLPPEIRSRASYVRPYHFWLSAFLAKELLAQGYSPGAAIEAVHRIGLVYELKASSVATVSARLLGVDPVYTLETQKDLAFNAAGAAYGVARQMKRPLDLDVDPVFAVWKRHADSPPARPRYTRISDAFYVAPSFLQPVVEMAIGGRRLLAQINALEPFVPYEVWDAQLAALTGPNGVLAFPGPCASLAQQ